MISNLLKRVSKIEPSEIKTTFLSFILVFMLMMSYYILRPVRDAMASDWSDAQVSFLWTLNFVISTVLVAFYGFAVSHIKFRQLVPSLYGFFATTFVLFYFGIATFSDRILLDQSFYVWVSVYALFHVSVFWSLMSDFFNKEQAKRLFAIIASGASAGALLGPSIPVLLADRVGGDTLIMIAAMILMATIPVVLYLGTLKHSVSNNPQTQAVLSKDKIGGNPFAGFKQFLSNRYLLHIAIFILLYTMINSFIYFEQKNLLAIYERETRIRILGSIDWITNLLTFSLAFFATSRLVLRFKMGFTLALLPMIAFVGLLILAFAPLLIVILALQVARRSGNYAITRPAREMLFTEVDRESRFKAKPVIDIVAYRGGDMVSSWIFAALTQGLGLGLAAVALIGSGIAVIWATVGWRLGGIYQRDKQQQPRKSYETS